METTDERAHKSIFARAKSGGNGCKVSEKRFFDGSGSRGNKEKTARWAVLSKFLRPKQGETEAKQCFARGSTRLGKAKSVRLGRASAVFKRVRAVRELGHSDQNRKQAFACFLFCTNVCGCTSVLLLVPKQREEPVCSANGSRLWRNWRTRKSHNKFPGNYFVFFNL